MSRRSACGSTGRGKKPQHEPLAPLGEREGAQRQGEGETIRDQLLIKRAKSMRLQPTPAERILWLALRAKRFSHAKFRRQSVIGRYIADFSCRIPCMLVIEVDGDTHGHQANYDEARSAFLKAQGYRVLRFTNFEVADNLEGVLTIIQQALTHPLPGPLPQMGRGSRKTLP